MSHISCKNIQQLSSIYSTEGVRMTSPHFALDQGEFLISASLTTRPEEHFISCGHKGVCIILQKKRKKKGPSAPFDAFFWFCYSTQNTGGTGWLQLTFPCLCTVAWGNSGGLCLVFWPGIYALFPEIACVSNQCLCATIEATVLTRPMEKSLQSHSQHRRCCPFMVARDDWRTEDLTDVGFYSLVGTGQHLHVCRKMSHDIFACNYNWI